MVRQREVGETLLRPVTSKPLEYTIVNDENLNESVGTGFDSSICE